VSKDQKGHDSKTRATLSNQMFPTKIRQNMKLTFKLKVGEILFDEDNIILKDDAKKQKWYG
jgi:hypothetical protein